MYKKKTLEQDESYNHRKQLALDLINAWENDKRDDSARLLANQQAAKSSKRPREAIKLATGNGVQGIFSSGNNTYEIGIGPDTEVSRVDLTAL